jgi:CubicO group peptidase (beta-lactamase class C family)
MYERGQLDLDTPLVMYLPEPYARNDLRVEQITARMALSHTIGFPNRPSREGKLAICFDPVERFSYSEEGYIYLQRVVEHLAEMPLDEYMQQKIFAPLAMTANSYIWMDAYNETAAFGYDKEGKRVRKWKPVEPLASASLHTSVLDFSRFFCTLLACARGKSAWLKPESVDQMLSPR